jgi:4-hydroxythreonine-4-phosphate dehydrogenase
VTEPLVALSVGDPCGIGPEIALRLAAEGGTGARLLLLADRRVLARVASLVPGAPDPPLVPEARCEEAGPVALLAEADADGRRRMPTLPPLGRVDAGAGAASHDWVLRGCDLARSGRVAALVTGPIHKQAWEAAGVREPGHTEALARRAGAPRVLMVLEGGGLRVALATIHVALRTVPGLLTEAGLVSDLVLLDAELRRRMGVARPRIAVCGLNPHAGEGGRFGDEEERTIAPAVRAARARGVDASGPWPADACLPRAARGEFDAALAMYHDQGLAAVKVLAPREAVNVTLGLPFVRTSVDHGTAFDKAGAGTATASSLRAAVAAAVAMSREAGRSTPPAGAPT